MRQITILFIAITNVLFVLCNNITTSHCYATQVKAIKEQILNNEVLMQACKITDITKKPDTIFSYFFKDIVLDNGYTKQAINGIDIIHFEHKNGISDKDYLTIFGYDKGDISNKEYTSRVVLIDSICAYYGIKIEDLIEIRQSKHLINKKKREINELFNDCLEKLNEKFNRDKMIETITEKVLQKQNELSISTVPDCPPLI